METGVRSRPRRIDGPLENIETEGQKQLQSMLQKQLDKSATITEQLGRKREFSGGIKQTYSTEELSGIQTLKDFKALGDVDEYIEEMKSYGLTHEEILYKLESENDQAVTKKSKLVNPDYHDAKLKEINDKIASKKESLKKADTFSNVKPISRHEMELENAIAMANSKNKFLHKTLISARENKTTVDPNSPFNCVPEILEKMSKKSSVKVSCRSRKKNKEYLGDCKLECCVPKTVSRCDKCSEYQNEAGRNENEAGEYESEAQTSLCRSNEFVQCACGNDLTIQTCAEKPEDYVTKNNTEDCVPKGNNQSGKDIGKDNKKVQSKSSSFSVLTGNCGIDSRDVSNQIHLITNVEGIPEDVIRKYKLSVNEVKNIPRFENYTPGEPSNVLFVKNLSNKVSEEDLASLFIGFQPDDNNRIIFKLLNGRMKGQAFVTFTNTELAMKALELVNGYEFKGKPVIIQYGKKST
ncbi:U12 snRNA binding [Mactra antiquata]